MKVLMLGWEFPPFSTGGLGTASYGITKGLSNNGVDVTFVLPKAPYEKQIGRVRVRSALNLGGKVRFREISSFLSPYQTDESYRESLKEYTRSAKNSPISRSSEIYGSNLIEEVERYKEEALRLALEEEFDIVHAHDWMTFKAAKLIKEKTGKPMVVHVHATEFDRSGNNPNPYVYAIEKEGMDYADRIIAVSAYTKGIISERYNINPSKVKVVHNAVEHEIVKLKNMPDLGSKIVLFLGRLTLQKGPDYFLKAAKRILEKEPDVRFIVAGKGDMRNRLIEMASSMGIAKNVLFAGYLDKEMTEMAYELANVYVMPSVSEPFGITPLEALKHSTPVIISRQSGVSEVLSHCIKVDFWDVEKLASTILSVLAYPSLRRVMGFNGREEVAGMSWDESARKCVDVYNELITAPELSAPRIIS